MKLHVSGEDYLAEKMPAVLNMWSAVKLFPV